ncbi:hypothetical protein V8B97DRAFT_84284 [Scleroderma yunnanense]
MPTVDRYAPLTTSGSYRWFFFPFLFTVVQVIATRWLSRCFLTAISNSFNGCCSCYIASSRQPPHDMVLLASYHRLELKSVSGQMQMLNPPLQSGSMQEALP